MSDDTVTWVILRKAGNHYYLDMAVSVIQLNPPGQIGEPVWHIIGRMFSPSVEEKIEWEKCLSTSKSIVSGKPLGTRLLEILQEEIMPLIEAFQTLDGIEKVLLPRLLRGMGIRTEPQNLTGYRA